MKRHNKRKSLAEQHQLHHRLVKSGTKYKEEMRTKQDTANVTYEKENKNNDVRTACNNGLQQRDILVMINGILLCVSSEEMRKSY